LEGRGRVKTFSSWRKIRNGYDAKYVVWAIFSQEMCQSEHILGNTSRPDGYHIKLRSWRKSLQQRTFSFALRISNSVAVVSQLSPSY